MLVICHDGLDSVLCNQYALKSLADGTFYDYQSVYKATVPSWSSIYTGQTTKQHGIEGGWESWLQRKSPLAGKSLIWDVPGTVALYNLPLTYPPFPVNGWMVSGFPTPFNSGLTYPQAYNAYLKNYEVDLIDMMVKITDKNKTSPMLILSRHIGAYQNMLIDKGIRPLIEFIESKISNFKTLWDIHPVDTVFVGFSFLDHALHLRHKDIEQLYKLVDMTIQDIMSITKQEDYVVISDHGFVISENMSHTSDAVFCTNLDINIEKTIHEWDIKDILSPYLNL